MAEAVSLANHQRSRVADIDGEFSPYQQAGASGRVQAT
jgi:hypothetical protein